MAGNRASFWYPLLGLAFAVAGTDKLFGVGGYRKMFRRWNWTEQDMHLVGGAEMAGGVLIASESTRRAGGIILAMASGAVLASELKHGDTGRALPRLGMLGAAMLAMI